MNDANPYEAPSSQLEVDSSSKIFIFNRFSAWFVFGLSIITLGIYPIYWMFTRAMTLNNKTDNPIAMFWLYGLIAIVIFHYSILFLFPAMVKFELLVRAVRLVFSLVVIFSIRNRLQDIINADIGPIGTNLSGIMTFFFHAIYLQYKINEAIDSSKNALP